MPTLVQNTSGASAGGATTTLTLSGVTSGNCLIVEYLSQSSSAGTPTMADSNGTVATVRISAGSGSGTEVKACIGVVANANSGTHVFTLTAPSTARPSFGAVNEWSGIPTTSPADQVSSGGGSAVQTLSTGSTPATTQAVELVIACIGVNSSSGVSSIGITDPPAGFASLAVQQNSLSPADVMAAEICYQVVTSIGTQSVSWSWTDANTRAASATIATFFTISGPAPPLMYHRKNIIYFI